MKQSEVFPHLARLGPREGTHIIYASQQLTHRRPQADITDFDKVLYSYLQVEDVPDLLNRLAKVIEEQAEIEQKCAEEIDNAENLLRSKITKLDNRNEEIHAAAPWPGRTVPTNAETDTRIRTFVEDCGGSLERTDRGAVTREWLLEEAGRAIQELSAASKDAVQRRLTAEQVNLQQLETAKKTFEELTEQLQTAQARVESYERDLKSVLGDKKKELLLKERDDLVRQDRQLALYLALVRKAADYFEDFSPEECPVCDTRVGPDDILSQLQGRVGSDPGTAELDGALTSVKTRLHEINIAEVALEQVQEAYVSVNSRVAAARDRLEKLLDDPADLSSTDRKIERLAEHVRHLERELEESGTLLASQQDTLKNLGTEVRFQGYRSRAEILRRNLESGLEPAREAHRDFIDVLETLGDIREALQESFNNTLNGTLPKINELMTEVYGRLTQQASFPKIVVKSGPTEVARSLDVRVTSDRTPGESFNASKVLNGQAFNALNLAPYFVFSQFQAEALELDCLLIDDPSQSFDTSRVKLLMHELATAATHAQLIVASHEEDRFAPLINEYFRPGSYRLLRVTSFAPNHGPTLEYAD